jgi:hypothetical protein
MKLLEQEKEKWRNRREANPYGPSQAPPTEVESRKQGYMHSKVHSLVARIANPDTPADTRAQLLTSLATSIRASQGKTPQTPPADNENTVDHLNPQVFITFVTPEDNTLVAKINRISPSATEVPALQFAVNSTSPFLRLPIGKTPGTYLKGLFDTGGCCNMGDLSYHTAIKTKYPQLVKQVVELDTYGYAPINIGGIEGSVKITHIMTYHLPYTSAGGDWHALAIGLTDTLPVNTLFGLPFIIKADLQVNWKQHLVRSTFFDDEFEIMMDRPHKSPLESLQYWPEHDRVLVTTTETL